MKLENVDVAKLQLDDLPKFDKCPCELCDDGCFDRTGYTHHPECRRKQVQQRKIPLALRCPLSHYKSTFQAATTVSGGPADHRRQACLPPPDNEIPISFKNAPMLALSSQRDHYQPPPPDSIKKLPMTSVKQPNNPLNMRSVPMETQTQYQVEYVEKPFIPISLRPLKDPTKDSTINITEPTAAISSQTTTRSHYKSWQPSPSKPYSEMPAVVGHVLFPGTSRQFTTSSGSTFVPFPNVLQTKPAVRLENRGNLQLSGSMDLRTNYRDSYITHEPSSARSVSGERKPKANEENVYTRRSMNGISQTSFDYRPYPNHRPSPPVEMEPFVSQITIGNSFTPVVTQSQYRSDYEGIDTSRHPRQPNAAPKDHQKAYVAPTQKMDTMTVTQRDFQPLDITTLPRIRLVPLKSNISINDQRAPMENVSMSQFHYQPYKAVKTKRQYGEPIPDIYIPPISKFEGTTTTGETYRGQSGPPARAYVPEVRMINPVGEHDHNTNYRVDYHPHGLSLCAAKAYAIAQKKQQTVPPITAQ